MRRRIRLTPVFTFATTIGMSAALGGCTWSASPPMQPNGPRVALVSEHEFDAFADRITRKIPQAFSAPGTGMPPALALPSVSVERLNEQPAANDFARTLVSGLNDRLGGRTRFDQNVESARGPRSTLAFTDAENGTNPDRRVVTFTIVEPAGERELLRESMEFQPLAERTRGEPPTTRQPPANADAPRAAPAPAPRQPSPAPPSPASPPSNRSPAPPRPDAREKSPPQEEPPAASPPQAPQNAVESEKSAKKTSARSSKPVKLKLSLKGQALTDAIANRDSRYDPWTHAGAGGNLIFLDATTAERFWVQRIRSARTNDDRLKVDVDLRARGKKRDGRYRFVFYDDAENAISSTAAIKTEFEAYHGQTLSITASDRWATQWVCLFEED